MRKENPRLPRRLPNSNINKESLKKFLTLTKGKTGRSRRMAEALAARKVGIPRTTLRSFKDLNLKEVDQISPRNSNLRALPDASEAKLVSLILTKADEGRPMRRMDVLNFANKLVVDLGTRRAANPLKRRWVSKFLNRHPELSPRLAQRVSNRRRTAVSLKSQKEYDLITVGWPLPWQKRIDGTISPRHNRFLLLMNWV
jgi:hypothetical protein